MSSFPLFVFLKRLKGATVITYNKHPKGYFSMEYVSIISTRHKIDIAQPRNVKAVANSVKGGGLLPSPSGDTS